MWYAALNAIYLQTSTFTDGCGGDDDDDDDDYFFAGLQQILHLITAEVKKVRSFSYQY